MNKTATRVYIIRHGESIGNLNRICLGHTDLDLTELGYFQAEKTSIELKDVHFDAIYSSDLMRAVNTARPHAKHRGMEIKITEDFRELYFGDWENSSVDYLKTTFGEMFTVGWRQVFGDFTPPNGESVIHMADRMCTGLKKIAQNHRGGCVLVVSHAAAIRALWGKISGYKPKEWGAANPFPSNASYSIVDITDDEICPISYSCDKHLAEYSTNIQH